MKEKYEYNREERLRKREARYQKILNWIKDEPLSRGEIERKLEIKDLKIGENALIKDYLNQMVEEREIGYFSKSFEDKDYKWVFKQAYGKPWDMKKNIYYFYTPRSKIFFNELNNLIEDISDRTKCKQIIDKISNTFRALEVMSKFDKERFFNDKVVKMVLKKRGIKPTKENIKEEKDKTKKIILNFSKKVIKINVKIKELQEANGQKYFFIGNKKINVKKVNSFLDIPKSKMSHIMFWTSHHRETDKGRFMLYFMKRMFELFVEMEKDSQIKV